MRLVTNIGRHARRISRKNFRTGSLEIRNATICRAESIFRRHHRRRNLRRGHCHILLDNLEFCDRTAKLRPVGRVLQCIFNYAL